MLRRPPEGITPGRELIQQVIFVVQRTNDESESSGVFY